MSSTIQPLTASLQSMRDRPPASGISEFIDQFRASDTSFHRSNADALERTHAHLDTLSSSYGELLQYITSVTQTINDAIAAINTAIATISPQKQLTASATLTAATTNLTHADPENEGDLLFFKIFQDGTGGRAITWDTNFIGATTQLGVTLANTRYLFVFVGLDLGSGLKWVNFSLPRLDF